MPGFQAGQSGNPKGRPRGIQDRRVALRKLLEPHADALVGKAVELALSGDTTALRLCIERLIPPVKAHDEPVKLAGFKPGSLSAQGEKILAAMAKGTLSPDQTGKLLQALAAQARIVEVDELEQRVALLEQQHASSA